MEIKLLEVSGFIGCLESLRLPFKKEVRSDYYANWEFDSNNSLIIENDISINDKDLKLLQTLIKRGTEHAKSIRLINATFKIKAPLFWWSEMDRNVSM